MTEEKNVFRAKRIKDLMFCLLIIAVPAIQFAFFYVGVNANSIIMAFQKYEIDSNTNLGKYVFAGFANFKKMFYELKYGQEILTAFKNSMLVFFINILVGTTLALFFSLYIYKKMPGSKVFNVILFAPSILSSIVTVTMYKNFVEVAFPEIFHITSGMGLLSNPETKMQTLIFFMIWIGFGTQLLVYSGSMNTIDSSITEAGLLDGVNSIQEFIYIILPLIYPTIVTFLITHIAGIFTNQLNLYSFYGNGADTSYITIGYFLFRDTNLASKAEYPLLATYGIALTFIAAPITLIGKRLLEKLGPKTI